MVITGHHDAGSIAIRRIIHRWHDTSVGYDLWLERNSDELWAKFYELGHNAEADVEYEDWCETEFDRLVSTTAQ